MCGIIGYIGVDNRADSHLIAGLKTLEYRGYDSAGLALYTENGMFSIKEKGRIANLEAKYFNSGIKDANMGIAHTRWATHGIPSVVNSHPHTSGKVTIVHNGIIENYKELKEFLTKEGYKFISETDTEVAAAYIDYEYSKTKDCLKALEKAYHNLVGSFAFGIIFEGEEAIYAMRKESPLLVARNDEERLIASDISAILAHTKEYYVLEKEQIARLSKDGVVIYDLEGKKLDVSFQISSLSADTVTKGIYDHFMMKEIHDEPDIIRTLLNIYTDHENYEFKNLPDMNQYDRIHIVGCGSAYYAGSIAKSIFEKVCRIPTDIDIASEYRYKNPILTPKTLVIFISQSGETSDTLAALRHVNAQGVDTLGIVNVFDSSIAREAKMVAYTHAGIEVCVATTKAYIAQVAILSFLGLKALFGRHVISEEQYKVYFEELYRLPSVLENIINSFTPSPIIDEVAKAKDVFFLGRGLDYALCNEASLKLKEISYIHSESYAAGELKHGSIALIEEGTIVVGILTSRELYKKTLSNIQEVKARGARIILFVMDELLDTIDMDAEEIYHIPTIVDPLQPLVSITSSQLFAYYIARSKGCEIDKPRNLAKSVTVE